MGRGATGPSGDVVYSLSALPTIALTVRPDPTRPDKHALLEPASVMPLLEYESALTATRAHWGRVWP